jgi:hypothetical protein
MKIIWATSFREFSLSSINDKIQLNFLKKAFFYKKDIKICLTQFGEKKILGNIKNYKKNIFYFDCKKLLPKKIKYSQTIVLDKALNCLLNYEADILIWSTADIEFSINNKFLNSIEENAAYTFFPNKMQIFPKKKENKNYPYYGLDVFIFCLNKKKIKEFIKINKSYSNFDWGCFEHFLMAATEKLGIKIVNLYTTFPIIKYANDRKFNSVIRTNEIYSWKKNQDRLINFLKKNKLSRFYATGSMYFLAYKLIKNSKFNLNLILIYFRLFFQLPVKSVIKIFYYFRFNKIFT